MIDDCRAGARWWWRCAAATAVTLAGITTAAVPASAHEQTAPVETAGSGGIAGQYIVVLKGRLPTMPTERSEDLVAEEDRRIAGSVHAIPLFQYNADLKGFSAHLTEVQLYELRRSPDVEFIEEDARVVEMDTQTGAPWNLARIDERALSPNDVYHYSPTAGRGVDVYVLDTGISATHRDFGGRASNAFDALPRLGGSGADCNGHGTAVAGIVGGQEWGVAKRATLVGVRVLDCSGSGAVSGVIAGVNWITEHHVADKSVANMSLGGSASAAMNDAVQRLIDSGVFVSVAAGDSNGDACNYSPARVPAAFTTAASVIGLDDTDRPASFSNWGRCVDAYAPGVGIRSDWIGNDTAVNTLSGTSMAAPEVAGTAALYLAEHPSTPAETTTWIIDHATPNVIVNNKSATPNLMLYKADL